jgi:hypothetical protein
MFLSSALAVMPVHRLWAARLVSLEVITQSTNMDDSRIRIFLRNSESDRYLNQRQSDPFLYLMSQYYIFSFKASGDHAFDCSSLNERLRDLVNCNYADTEIWS